MLGAARAGAHAGARDLQVRWHGGDDGAVSHRAGRLERRSARQGSAGTAVFVTDPEVGALRPIATRRRDHHARHSANVGGRFSVLSPVGMLPAALIGIDVVALLAGARPTAARAHRPIWRATRPGVCRAAVAGRHAARRHVHALMPYADPLRDIASWFVQLWAESLGKIRADGTSVGPTPLPALGATDQHARCSCSWRGRPTRP
jgi:glucose-6-phosphate isomerase